MIKGKGKKTIGQVMQEVKVLLSEVEQGRLVREMTTNMSTSMNKVRGTRIELKEGQHFWVMDKAEDILALRKILVRLY